MIRQEGRRYELRLETPSISFVPEPAQPGRPTYEQEYHASAARQFQEILAPLEGALDEAIDALLPEHAGVELLPFDGELPLVHARGRPVSGACRISESVGCPPDLSIGFGQGTLSLAFAQLPEGGALERLFDAVADAIWNILREHHARQRDATRRGPVPPEPLRFHYTCAADGTIEDLNGDAPGRPLAAERLPAPDALALCGTIAAIVAAAEDDGVVHAELDASHLRIDGAEVSIDRFGEASSEDGHPPEGGARFFAPPRLHIDWIARQRYGLGRAIFEVLAGRALDVPRAPAAEHDAAVGRALAEIEPAAVRGLLAKLLAWTPARRPSARSARAVLAAAVGRAAPAERRAASKIPARFAADTRGILDRCCKCGRPALRHAGRDIPTAEGYRPDCCWRERERRMLRAGGALLLAAAAALIAWWVY